MSPPCELHSYSDHITVVLRPNLTESSWSEIESFGSDVRSELESRKQPACVVDLSPLTYMGSALVALVVRLWKVVQSRNGKMVVVCPNALVLDVIRLAGLDKVWSIAPEVKVARQKLGVKNGPEIERPGTTPTANDTTEIAQTCLTKEMDVVSEPAPQSQTSVDSPRRSNRLWYFLGGVATVLVVLLVIFLIQ